MKNKEDRLKMLKRLCDKSIEAEKLVLIYIAEYGLSREEAVSLLTEDLEGVT